MVTFRETEAGLLRKASGLGLDLRPHIACGRITVLSTAPVEISPDFLAWQICKHVVDGQIQRGVIARKRPLIYEG